MADLENLKSIFDKQPTDIINTYSIDKVLVQKNITGGENTREMSNQYGGGMNRELSTIGFNMNDDEDSNEDYSMQSNSAKIISKINKIIKQAGGNVDDDDEGVENMDGGKKHDYLTTLHMNDDSSSSEDENSEKLEGGNLPIKNDDDVPLPLEHHGGDNGDPLEYHGGDNGDPLEHHGGDNGDPLEHHGGDCGDPLEHHGGKGSNPSFNKLLKLRAIIADKLGLKQTPSVMVVASKLASKFDKDKTKSEEELVKEVKKWLDDNKSEAMKIYNEAEKTKQMKREAKKK